VFVFRHEDENSPETNLLAMFSPFAHRVPIVTESKNFDPTTLFLRQDCRADFEGNWLDKGRGVQHSLRPVESFL